jgi:myo-inositol-1-phosphate synthase
MEENKVGVWLIGALGSVSATVITGALAIGKGLISSKGMITSTDAFSNLGLVDVARLRFGGCDVRKGSILEAVRQGARESRAFDPELVGLIEEDVQRIQPYIQKGTNRNCGEIINTISDPACKEDAYLIETIETIRNSIRFFKQGNGVNRVVVVNLASTEPLLKFHYCHGDLDDFETALKENDVDAIRASTLYAYAALKEGCAFINFTPSNGALIPAIIQLADKQGLPIMGNDGKTGETLIKSALAPMFSCRDLKVMSWEGFNILGNRDGQVLNHPENRETKIRSKDQTLTKVLGYSPHSKVGINYVPSLGDQKTAWDFIHFKGFLGATMSLQFIWQGYDSILAAPLVLDLVRLAELAMRRGEKGVMPHLASFFKSPIGVSEYRLYEQFQMLLSYADHVRKDREKMRIVN